MRIIAGNAKGRNISSVASATRPTSDRAREALFSTLTSEFGELTDLNVLDLYAGTGAIALESLSRGAAIVHAVEKDEQAQKSIAANFEALPSFDSCRERVQQSQPRQDLPPKSSRFGVPQ